MTRFSYGLTAALIGTTIAIEQPQRAVAMNADEVSKLAKEITVLIQGPGAPGSGVIIAKDGNTYTVITAKHVVKDINPGEEAYIIPYDGQRYRMNTNNIRKLSGIDLAVLQFSSSTNYTTAKMGDSNDITEGSVVYISGFPLPTETINRSVYNFTDGRVTANSAKPLADGYALIYNNQTLPGMSGGPVLNSKGELVGIHGKAEISRQEQQTSNVYLKTGFNLGVPINAFLSLSNSGIAAAQQERIVSNTNVNVIKPPANISLNGRTISATLTTIDKTLSDGSLFKNYQFEGRSGQPITIDMRSDEVDSYLVLFDPKGDKLAEDDDSGGGKNAQINVTLPVNGTYTLYANSYKVGKTGRFTLNAKVANASPTTATMPTRSQPNVVLQRNGVLGTGSNVLARDGSLFETFSFAGRAGQLVQITLTSSDFHPYLVLFAPDRRLLKEDNGLPDRKNALVTLELPATGTYRVVANAFDKTGRGAYTLTVRTLR